MRTPRFGTPRPSSPRYRNRNKFTFKWSHYLLIASLVLFLPWLLSVALEESNRSFPDFRPIKYSYNVLDLGSKEKGENEYPNFDDLDKTNVDDLEDTDISGNSTTLMKERTHNDSEILDSRSLEKSCATVEEMGKSVVKNTDQVNLRLRHFIKNYILEHGNFGTSSCVYLNLVSMLTF